MKCINLFEKCTTRVTCEYGVMVMCSYFVRVVMPNQVCFYSSLFCWLLSIVQSCVSIAVFCSIKVTFLKNVCKYNFDLEAFPSNGVKQTSHNSSKLSIDICENHVFCFQVCLPSRLVDFLFDYLVKNIQFLPSCEHNVGSSCEVN